MMQGFLKRTFTHSSTKAEEKPALYTQLSVAIQVPTSLCQAMFARYA